MKRLVFLVALFLFVPPAIGGGAWHSVLQVAVNVTPPPACGNTLDFSDGCNSQYIPVVL